MIFDIVPPKKTSQHFSAPSLTMAALEPGATSEPAAAPKPAIDRGMCANVAHCGNAGNMACPTCAKLGVKPQASQNSTKNLPPRSAAPGSSPLAHRVAPAYVPWCGLRCPARNDTRTQNHHRSTSATRRASRSTGTTTRRSTRRGSRRSPPKRRPHSRRGGSTRTISAALCARAP